jgi:predicted amidophosphoribosyltransferase
VTGLLPELIALVAPAACPACHAALAGADVRLCPDCAAALPWLPRGVCAACSLPAHRRGACPAGRAAFARAWAPLAYDGVARELVGALKFRGALPLANLMAAHMAANLPRDVRAVARSAEAEIVPVPAHAARRRRRGFDPAAALAHGFAQRLDLPVADCLRRRDHAPRQVGRSRAARRLAGRLTIEPRAAPPEHALLVDDVHTTGATLDACARALRAAGCAHVTAVTYARTL